MRNVIRRLAVAMALVSSISAASANADAFVITIERNMTCQDQSTVGRLMVNGKEIGRTLELPWRNNETSISRIPPGTYGAKIRSDGARKWRVQLEDVTDAAGHTREYVQIHVGNYASQIEGCILVGADIVRGPQGQCMVPNSAATLQVLADEMAEFAEGLGQNSSADIEISVVVR